MTFANSLLTRTVTMSTAVPVDDAGLPGYLSTPACSPVPPPVETRHQSLPFGEPAGEDFERLCLRLARREADVLHCQLYGTRGQNQSGIDLYARLTAAGEFRVYQCKRR